MFPIPSVMNFRIWLEVFLGILLYILVAPALQIEITIPPTTHTHRHTPHDKCTKSQQWWVNPLQQFREIHFLFLEIQWLALIKTTAGLFGSYLKWRVSITWFCTFPIQNVGKLRCQVREMGVLLSITLLTFSSEFRLWQTLAEKLKTQVPCGVDGTDLECFVYQNVGFYPDGTCKQGMGGTQLQLGEQPAPLRISHLCYKRHSK